jgi:hypothetical protein
MLLSEGLIWNVYPVLAAAERGPAAVGLAVCGVTLLYTLQFALFADLVLRWRVHGLTAMFLLGSMHGLLLEGVFADLLYRLPGRVLGLSVIGCLFPALSWHAALDFVLPFVFVRAVSTGRLRFDRLDLGFRVPWQPAAALLFWFSWSLVRLHQARLPAGMPLWVQLLFVLYPLLLIGLLLFLLSRRAPVEPPAHILTPRMSGAAWGLVATAFLLRVHSLGDKRAGVALLALFLFYALLFRLWQGSLEPGGELVDRVSEAFPLAVAFRPGPYLAWVAVAVLGLIAFRSVSELPSVRALCSLSCTVQIIGWMLFAGLLPVVVLFRWMRRSAAVRAAGRRTG